MTVMRKSALGLLAAALLSACSSAQETGAGAKPFLPVAKAFWSSVTGKQAAGQMPQFTRAQINGATSQLMLLELESDRRGAAFALADMNSGTRTYASGDGNALIFRQGVVIASRGFGLDLMSSQAPSLAAIATASAPYGRSYQILGDDDQLVARDVTCQSRRLGAESLVISERRYSTQKIVENCRNDQVAFENEYWVESGGQMRQSRQWLGDGIGRVYLADPM